MEGVPICPICGQECEDIILYKTTGEVVGCDCCLESEDAWSWYERQVIDDEAVRADMAYDYMKDMRVLS